MRTIILLTISNLFMNLAWYGHLKFRNNALWIAILVSWGIAFFEYLFQVPANRIGSYEWTVPQLKVTPGMHHADRLHARGFRALSFAGAVELPRLLFAHRGRGLFRVQILGLCVQCNPHRASARFARWTRSIFSWLMCTPPKTRSRRAS